jgi:hypothetical protein
MQLNKLVKREIRTGNRPYRTVTQKNRTESYSKADLLKQVIKADFPANYLGQYREQIMKVAEDRFTQQSHAAFSLLKRLTKYDNFEKRDGGLVVSAYQDNTIVEGEVLENAIMNHYRAVHTSVPGLQKEGVKFPRMYPTP